MENVKSSSHREPFNYINNNIVNNNEIHNLDSVEEDEAMLMMNNNFFNDDIYNYKDTFLSGRSNSKTNTNNDPDKSNNTSNSIKNYAFEDDDFDLKEDEYDDDDENNDFGTGPLALNIKSRHENNFEQLTENLESLKFHKPEQDDDTDDGLDHQAYFEKIYDDDEEEGGDNALMMDTFFKRVDSLELVKPKKAKIIKGYLMGELLGDGSYGKVKECLDMNSLARRAVKIINLKMVARKIPRGVENVRKEISIMKHLNHKNVIKLYDTFEKGNTNNNNKRVSPISDIADDEMLAQTAAMINLEKPPKIYIFMDYCMTNLEKLLKNAPDQRLGNWQANFYFKQLIDGLEYLHSLNIIHNDIKPGNLLITCDDVLKLCDFSISTKLSIFCEEEYKMVLEKKNDNAELEENSQDLDANEGINPNLLSNNASGARFPIIQCTPMFQCPEMLDEDIDEILILRNATKIDVWSTGITLFQLTTGDLPFHGQTLHQIFENIRSPANLVKIPVFIDKNLNKLLIGMLDKSPLTRWSLQQIRDSEWFKKKHPLIREDLALLPAEIFNNECGSSFRMINYLEKYCESFHQQHSSNNTQTQQEIHELNYDNSYDLKNNLPSTLTQTELDHHQLQSTNSLRLNSSKSQNGNTNNFKTSQQSSNQYNQSGKMKKTHCDIM